MYDPLDPRGVPISKGVPMAVRIAASIGVLIVFAIGAFVISQAGFGHHWPWQTNLRVPLKNTGG